jgi:DNA primase
MLNGLPSTSPLIEDVAALIWLAQQIALEVESVSITEYPLAHWTLLAQLSQEAGRRVARVQSAAQEAIADLVNVSRDGQFWEYETV